MDQNDDEEKDEDMQMVYVGCFVLFRGSVNIQEEIEQDTAMEIHIPPQWYSVLQDTSYLYEDSSIAIRSKVASLFFIKEKTKFFSTL